jgi:predicted nucleotidyltransferase
MSGNFTQRGEAAILDKHTRAKAAIEGGADLVISLPVAYATGSAERFAFGAVKLTEELGCVGMLSFGSECGDVELLGKAAGAAMFAEEEDSFKDKLKRGVSYPVALEQTIGEFYDSVVTETLAKPNNILAAEYLKVLANLGSRIKPVTVTRTGADHDSDAGTSDNIASASQIRTLMRKGGDYSRFVPNYCYNYDDIAEYSRLERALLYKLRTTTPDDMRLAPNVLHGFENRIIKAAEVARSYEELLLLCQTKRYTNSRVKRALNGILLGIEKRDENVNPSYVHILAMNSRGKEILTACADCKLPISASLSQLAAHSREAKRAARLEARADDVYALMFRQPRPSGEAYRKPAVIIQ